MCLRSDAIPETWPPAAKDQTAPIKTGMEKGTALGRLSSLHEIANAATFAASERASAITGAIINLTCGSIVDLNQRFSPPSERRLALAHAEARALRGHHSRSRWRRARLVNRVTAGLVLLC